MTRVKEFSVDNVFINRWSSRAMSGENISDEELMTLFEAAKWAPSSRNEQPWKFIYAKRENIEQWQTFLSILAPSNELWAKNAAVLILVISKKTFDKDNSINMHNAFDAGAAWENLALQASMKNFVAHAMGGKIGRAHV